MLSRTLIRKNAKILHSREFGPIPKFPIVPYNINLITFRRSKLALKYRKAKKPRIRKFVKVPATAVVNLFNINLLYRRFFKRAKIRKRVRVATFKYKANTSAVLAFNRNLVYRKVKRIIKHIKTRKVSFNYKVFLQNNAPVVLGASNWVGVAIRSVMRRGGK